jgi:hypothetical protein
MPSRVHQTASRVKPPGASVENGARITDGEVAFEICAPDCVRRRIVRKAIAVRHTVSTPSAPADEAVLAQQIMPQHARCLRCVTDVPAGLIRYLTYLASRDQKNS